MKKKKKSAWQKFRTSIIAMPDLKLLLFVYLLFSTARFLLALATTEIPIVYPDESLYLNLAKSIITQGTTLFKGQRINYIFLLYSLLISPVSLLSDAVNVFHAIQALNCLLITLSIFPVFALARGMTGSRAKAWLTVFIVLLLPDMTLSRHLLEENLAYPAQFAAFALIYKSLKDDAKIPTLSFTILLCALLPFIKPHLLAVGGAFCLMLLIQAFTGRSLKKAVIAFVCSALLGLLVFLLYKALTLFFTANLGGETVFYVTSLHLPSLEQIINTLKASSLYLYFFTVACCILPFLVPISYMGSITGINRRFMGFTLLAFIVTIVGASYTINLNEMSESFLSGRVHLRYIDAYLPLFVLLFLDSGLHAKRVNMPLGLSLGALFLFNIVIGPSSSTSGEGNMIDFLPLVLFIDGIWMKNPKLLLQILTGLGTVTAAYAMIRYGFTKNLRRVTLFFLIFLFVLANAAGYHTKPTAAPGLPGDVREIASKIGSAPTVILAKNGEISTGETSALDTYLPSSVPVVELDDLLYKLNPDSAYSPFYPKKVKWEAIVTDRTPPEAWFVMISSSLEYMKLLPSVQTLISKNDLCAAIYLQSGQPWLSSALSGHVNGILENSGEIIVYDTGLLSRGTLYLDLTIQSMAEGNQAVFSSDLETKTVRVGVKATSVSIELQTVPGQLPMRISIHCDTSMLRVNEYSFRAGD